MASVFAGMVLKELLKYTVNKVGRKIFEKKPSKFSDAEVKKLVKGLNDRLYKMEKAGVAEDSKLYQNLKKYAKDGSNLFNIKGEKVRVTSDLARFGKGAAKLQNINYLLGYLTASTSTVGGTKQAIKKAYETFKNNPALKGTPGENMTLEEYKRIWKVYRDHVSEDKKGVLGSEMVVNMFKKQDFYSMSTDQIVQAMKYTDQIQSTTQSTANNELFDLWKKGGVFGKMN